MILVLHFGRWCRRHEPCVVVRVRDVKKFDGIEVELSRGGGEASVGKAYFWLRIRSPRRSVAVNCSFFGGVAGNDRKFSHGNDVNLGIILRDYLADILRDRRLAIFS